MVWLGSGLMWEYERLDQPDPEVERTFRGDVRWSSYAALRLATEDQALIAQPVVYVQPRVDALDDLRVLVELSLETPLFWDVSAGIRFSVLHDTAPPQDVVGTDMRLTQTLRLEL